MILEVMSVYDTKARAYLVPFFVRSIEVGQRAVYNAVNDKSHEWYHHSADFHLFHFGAFADDNGAFGLLKEPRNLGPLSQFKVPESYHGEINPSEREGAKALQQRIDNQGE